MKLDPKLENDDRVRDNDGWIDEFEDMPDTWGVFFFVDDKEDVKYIGLCEKPDMGPVAKAAYDAGKGKGATKMAWASTFSVEKAQSLHAELVAKYKPVNNK